jgi:hypothetical protein
MEIRQYRIGERPVDPQSSRLVPEVRQVSPTGRTRRGHFIPNRRPLTPHARVPERLAGAPPRAESSSEANAGRREPARRQGLPGVPRCSRINFASSRGRRVRDPRHVRQPRIPKSRAPRTPHGALRTSTHRALHPGIAQELPRKSPQPQGTLRSEAHLRGVVCGALAPASMWQALITQRLLVQIQPPQQSKTRAQRTSKPLTPSV